MANENLPTILSSTLSLSEGNFTIKVEGPFQREDEDVKGNWYAVTKHDNINEGTMKTIVPFDGNPALDKLGFIIAMFEGMKRNEAILGVKSSS